MQTIGLPTGASGNSLTAANPLGNVEDERNSDWTYRTDRFGHITEWREEKGEEKVSGTF